MRKLVVFPSDPIDAYIEKGATLKYLDEYYNPGDYFDEVYIMTPWKTKQSDHGKIKYISEPVRKYKEIIKKIGPVAVRAYGGYHSSEWMACSRVKGIPTLVSIHDTNPELIFNAVKYADYIICMADCVKESVINKLGIPDENIFILPNRVDIEMFSNRLTENKRKQLTEKFGEGKHLLHVGRKVEQKNLESVIKSLKYLKNDVSAIFVGTGDSSSYINLAKEVGVYDRCYFINSVPIDELADWFTWCDCMCTPSLWEGFGKVFMEAASSEAAIVTSDIAPMNTYLKNNNNAVLVRDYRDPREIAKAVKKIIYDEAFSGTLRKNARKVGYRFSKDVVDKAEIEIYKYAIEHGSVCKKMNIRDGFKIYWRYKRFWLREKG